MTSRKKFFLFLLKLALSAILLSLLFSKAGLDKMLSLMGQISGLSMIAALSCYLLIIFISAIRLRLLIQDRLPLKTVFSISAIGYFFNLLLPSGISGDVARAYYMSIEIRAAKKTGTMDLVAPLVMERYVGLGSVLAVGLIVFPFAFNLLDNRQLNDIIAVIIILLLTVFFLGLALLKFRIFHHNRLVSDFYRYIDAFQDKKRLTAVFLHSIFIQIVSIGAIFFLSEGMNLHISLFYLVVVIPMINIVTLLPITLGGLGMREGAFVLLLASQGIPAHVAISLSLLSFAASVIASLVGFYEYMRYRKKAGVPLENDRKAIKVNDG